MIIEKIEIGAFGKLKDFSMDLNSGVNVIYGENEAGKSTICTFLYAMFYDLPSSKQKYSLREDLRRRYQSWSGEQMEGGVYFSHEDKKYVLKRKIGKTPKGSKVQLLDAETWEEITDERKEEPGKYFFGVGEDGFLKTLYISQLGAQIKKEKDDEIIKRLSNLRQSGDEDISYQKTLDRLNKQKHTLISVGGGAGKIVALKKENEQLRGKLADVLESEKIYKEALSKKHDAENKKEELLIKQKELETSKALTKKYENYKLLQKAKEDLKALLEVTENIKEAFLESSSKIEELRLKEKEFEFLENADEETVKILSDAEKKTVVLEQKLALINEKNIEAEKIENEIESLKTDKEGKMNKGFLCAGIAVFCSSIVLAFLLLPLSLIGIIPALILITLAIIPIYHNKERKEKINELFLKLSAIKPTPEEENAILKELKEEKENIDKILKRTRCTDSSDLLRKISEKKNLKDIITACENENSLIRDNLEKAEKEIEILNEKSQISYYPEGVINIEGPTAQQTQSELLKLSEEMLMCEKRLTEAETTLLSLSKEEQSSTDIKNLIEVNNEEIGELSKTYEAIEKAIVMIEECYGVLRNDFAPLLSEKVKEAVSFLTDGKYTDVRVADDYSLKVQSKADIIDADYLSGGTYDILYLALRLGISKVISDGGAPVLILDDAFLQFDDKRTKKAAEYIMEKGANQVLYFTCHENQTGIFGSKSEVIKI